MTNALSTRPFEHRDVPTVLALMHGLAIFEGYIDKFAVTEEDLVDNGLGDAPRFGVLVAELDGRVIGIAVHYVIPWTYDLKPTVVLKELFVEEGARSSGAGAALIAALKRHATAIGAPRVNWTVLAGNEPAKRFYRHQGGAPDELWEPWTMAVPSRDGS
ncbi:N-acetyltransferase family protein [Ensifer canadensis]